MIRRDASAAAGILATVVVFLIMGWTIVPFAGELFPTVESTRDAYQQGACQQGRYQAGNARQVPRCRSRGFCRPPQPTSTQPVKPQLIVLENGKYVVK